MRTTTTSVVKFDFSQGGTWTINPAEHNPELADAHVCIAHLLYKILIRTVREGSITPQQTHHC